MDRIIFYINNNYSLYLKRHWREPENVYLMSSQPLYTYSNDMHYSLNGENETALYRQWFVI